MAKSKAKKINWGQWGMMGVFVLIGAACGLIIITFLERFVSSVKNAQGKEWLLFALLLIVMYLTMLVQIVVHEAGHLICGLLTGYRFSSFRIGGLMWVKDGDKVRLRRYSLAGTGGQCLMLPPDMHDGKMPYVLYNLGGPLINLVLGIVFTILAAVLGTHPLAQAVCAMMAVTGLAFALTNGLPLSAGGLDNDGRNAISLGKSPEALQAFRIQMLIGGALASGARVKDLPEEWLLTPSEAGMQNPMVAAVGAYRCNRLLDAHCFEEADELMRQLLADKTGMLELHKNQLRCDRIYCALLRGDLQTAKALDTKELQKFMKAMKTNPSVLRTQYALARIMENDAAKAEKLKQQFERVARTYPYQGDAQGERELLELAEKTAQTEATA